MNDRRNWKAELSLEAQERNRRKLELLAKLDGTRREIQACGTDFVKYDLLKAGQREIVAELATL